MRIIQVIMILMIGLTLGCSKEDGDYQDCIDKVLEEFDMTEYTGQDLDSKFFFRLYEYDNQPYFLLDNHCVDMISYPIDCDGNTLCEENENVNCLLYQEFAEFIEIVGVSE